MSLTNTVFLIAETEVNAPMGKVWKLWTTPEDIMQWNTPSTDWKTLRVDNDVRAGGKFLFVMAAKDGSSNFDYSGTYGTVKTGELITHTLDDGRKTTITFTTGRVVKITETFEAMPDLSFDMQKDFCQRVLNQFKNYAEAKVQAEEEG